MPSREELERERLALGNEKIRLELEQLRKDAQPESRLKQFLKDAAPVGVFITIFATLFGIWDTYDKTILERQHQLVADLHVRIEDAMKRLESSTQMSKLLGVSVLSSYLNHGDSEIRRQVFFSYASLMATDPDTQIQSAVYDLVDEAKPPSTASEGNVVVRLGRAVFGERNEGGETDWRYFDNQLVKHNRNLVKKAGLAKKRKNLFGATEGEPLTPEEKSAQGLGHLIALIARKNIFPSYGDFHGIYCVACDFRDVVFPDHADFTGAILDRADFSHATLRSATFDNAHLLGARFISADLYEAYFRSLDDDSRDSRKPALSLHTRYLEVAAAALGSQARVNFVMPDFSCAKLVGAHFDGHALFPGVQDRVLRTVYKDRHKNAWWADTAPSYAQDWADQYGTMEFDAVAFAVPKFFKANLKGADFENVRFFGIEAKSLFGEGYFQLAMPIPAGEYVLHQGVLGPLPFGQKTLAHGSRELRALTDFRRGLPTAFFGSNFPEAKLPPGIKALLAWSKPNRVYYSWVYPQLLAMDRESAMMGKTPASCQTRR